MNRALAAFVLVLTAATAAAQSGGDSGSKVRVKRAVRERDVVVLDLTIEPSWHIYAVNAEGTVGNATKVSVDGGFEIAGKVTEPEPKHHKKDYTDPDTKEIIYTEEYDAHEGEITLRVPIKGSGAGPVKGSLDVTACDANVCLQPGKVKFKAEPAEAASTDSRTSRGSPASRTSPKDEPPTPSPQKSASPGGPDTRSDPPRPERKVIKDPKRLGKFEADDPFQVIEISYPDPITSDRFDVTVVAEIKPGYHVYGFTKGVAITGIPTTFQLSAPPGATPAIVLATAGLPASEPAPKHKQKKFEDYEYLDGRVTFRTPVKAKWAAGKAPESAGEIAFPSRFSIGYQTCTEEFCLRPAAADFDLPMTASAGLAISPDDPPANTGAGGGGAPGRAAVVDARVSFEPPTLEPNSTATLVARLRRLDGKPIVTGNAEARIALAQGQGLIIDGAATATTEADGSVTLRAPVRVAADAPEKKVVVSGRASYGGLDGEFTGDVQVIAPLLGFLLIAIASAFGALLTPCVFPMIPVTMSFFTKQAETGQQHPAKLATIYCVGIVVSFTAIGALFTWLLKSGSAANEFAGHWITQLVITALFVFFALSLLGLFDLSVPQPIMNMVERSTTRRMEFVAQGKGIPLAVLMMGLLFAVTTFTCTAPFIGGLLVGAATSGFTRPVIGMFAFSLALAVPFFFLALFPSQLKKLPKAGGWLNETKVVMGFIELAAAVKFVASADLALGWGIFTRNVCLALWIAIHALTGLYLVGVFRMPKDMPRQKTGVIALLLAMLFLTIAIYLTTGLNGKPLAKFVEGWLPPIEDIYSRNPDGASGGESSAGIWSAKTGWANRFEDDYEGALKEAKAHDLPLFVDFTGWSCANCRAVEAAVFMSSRDVRKQLEDFVVASLHMDGKDQDLKDKHSALAMNLIQNTGMPQYAIVDPKTMKVVNSWGWENADPARWKPLLKDALERWKTLKQQR